MNIHHPLGFKQHALEDPDILYRQLFTLIEISHNKVILYIGIWVYPSPNPTNSEIIVRSFKGAY